MKKLISAYIIIFLMISAPLSAFGKGYVLNYDGTAHNYTGTLYKLKVNGKLVSCDVPPVILYNRTMIPVRASFESLGAALAWDSKAKKFQITFGSAKLELTADSKIAKINNKEIIMDSAAKLVNERMVIPASFFSKNLNLSVGLFPEKGYVTLDSKSTAQPGKLESIKYSLNGSKYEISINLSGYKSYNTMVLPNPDRIVLDINNVQLTGEQKNVKINNKIIKTIRYSQFDAQTVRIVVDLSSKSSYQVIEKEGKLVLILASSVKPTSSRGGDIDRGNNNEVITIENPKQDTESGNNGGTKENEPEVKPEPTPNADTGAVKETGKDQIPAKGYEIKHISAEDKDEVSIYISEYKNYNIFTLTEPDRIIIDIPYMNDADKGTEQKIQINGKFIRDVRYSQTTKDILRVVLDVDGTPDYTVLENNGHLSIQVHGFKNTPIINKGAVYQNTGDRVCLIVSNSKLTEGGATIKKLYSESYDETGKKYTMTFPNSFASRLESGLLDINDNILESIEIHKDKSQTSITFNAKSKFYYNAYSRSELNDTAITILKPAAKEDKLVVIDPGHGGVEPGAIFANVIEKDLNLDISQRLYALLKSKNIKVHILRSDDSFLGLYERTNIANNLNAALFLSIHNNAYYANSKGTETLYNFSGVDNGGFNSKKFAQNIQNSLIGKLKMIDRGIVYRPNLAVLKGTVMPAALAEIGFITNDDDRAKLLDSEFRQKSAEALCESVIQSLSMLK